jgi:[CysO sulfur-carrier protein]-S-L-cysteine hydrolase
VVDLTVQRRGGSFSWFLRAVDVAVAALRNFFRRTENDFRRFNYLGEWHSHPSFQASPSATDIATVTEIATDESVGANFVVLVIVRLQSGEVEGSATLFLPDGTNQPAVLELEEVA